MPCEHALEQEGMVIGRLCGISKTYCANWNREDTDKCPTKETFQETKVNTSITPDMGYPGIPKCFRTGSYGGFDGGMPPNYLKGKLRKSE
jgi:hypothetical protein